MNKEKKKHEVMKKSEKREEEMVEQQMLMFMKNTILAAGKETLKYLGKAKIQYTKDNDADVVTQADLASNKIITSAIKKAYPNHNILSEETGRHHKKSEYTWIVDPIDGTYNFAHHSPLYGVMIALAHKNDIIMASIYLPYFEELLYAIKDKGAYINDKRIHCTKKNSLEHTQGVGSFSLRGRHKKQIQKLIGSSGRYSYWMGSTATMCVDAAYVAQGTRDWYYAPYLWDGIWDYAAPVLIMREAGCTVTDFNGSEWNVSSGSEMIAANPALHKKIMKIIR